MFKNKNLLLAGTALMFMAGLPAAANAVDVASAGMSHKSSAVIKVTDDRTQAAQAFIEQLTKRGIDFLANPDLTLEQRKGEFKELLQGSFDTKAIGRFTMGRYWAAASEAQREEFLNLFDTMIVNSYSRRFDDYKGQDIQVLSARPEAKSDAIVNSRIVDQNGQNISVDWRVREKDGSFKVIDVIVEGVSMATTQRSEFSSIIQRGGGNVQSLLDHLKS